MIHIGMKPSPGRGFQKGAFMKKPAVLDIEEAIFFGLITVK